MDKTVPAGAALLLDFIGSIEAPKGYGVLFANRQDRLDKPLTSMTIDEVLEGQKRWARWGKPASSAAGRYQFMRQTLLGLVKELGLRGAQKFDANLQDRLGYHLLRRRGYDLFMAGDIDLVEFGKRLAMEWASLPVLNATKGQHRQLKAGQSYYAGDGVNNALVKPADVAAALKQAFEAGNTVPREPKPPVFEPIPAEPLPAPRNPARPSFWPIILIGLAAAAVFAWQWFSGQQAPASLLGGTGAPTPLPRPTSLFGGGGGSIWTEIGLQLALPFLVPLISAAATAVIGWVGYWWARFFKVTFDQRSSDMLHAAIERAVIAAVTLLGSRAGKDSVLNKAAEYIEAYNPGSVKKFGLTRDSLIDLAAGHYDAAKRVAK